VLGAEHGRPDDLRGAALVEKCHTQKGHLDSITLKHHDVHMRTTVTLDKDVEKMLREAMHKSRRSFKETLNAVLRAGLGGKPVSSKRAPFAVKARPMTLREGIDPASLNKLADDLEIDAVIVKSRRRKPK
jgi:hypothetical protein